MATVRDLLKDSLRLIGVIASGETPSASEIADGLSTLNGMLDAWSTENLHIYARTHDEHAWTSGQASRTWGASGNFTTARPVEVESAAILQSSIELPLRVLTPQQWQSIPDKSTTSTLPTSIYFEGTYPNATMYLWPVPSAAVTLVTNTLKPLTAFASVDDTVSLPPGHWDALKFNLPIRLAPEYGRPLRPELLDLARETKENVKRKNIKTVLMKSDAFGLSGTYYRNTDFVSGDQ